jgi:dolichyl-diphosphooligosaccharide--protein glycosyltransferase/undecaprenyl-diphosphooligosaccharide--protein glycosyltransferase
MIYWHGGLYNVANGYFIMSTLYLMFLKFIKKEDINENTVFLMFLIIPLLPVSTVLKLIILIVFYIFNLYFENKYKIDKLIWIVISGYLILIGLPWLKNVLTNTYFTRAVDTTRDGVKYFSVVNTVREAAHIDWDVFVHRISGSWAGFILGVIGYIWMVIKYPKIIISLPMVVLGFFALKGGLRFTIFAVPFMALGNAFLFWKFAEYVSKIFINEKIAFYSKYFVSLVLMGFVIYPNYKHMYVYLVPTTFNTNEVVVLEKLKTVAKPHDYVLTWWDYGYPIRYYAKVSTLIDGGKHSGEVNFPVSFALTRPELPSYNAAILDVYFTEKDRKEHKSFDFVKQTMNMYHIKNVEEFENFLYHKIKLPKINHDIYYYLPYRMLNIFPTVALFSTIDLKTGKVKRHFFYKSNYRFENNKIILKNFVIYLKGGVIIYGKEKIPIKEFDVVSYNEKGELVVEKNHVRNEGINVIVMKSYNTVLLLDDFYYNSAYIQMFVMQNYDHSLFKPVILTPYVKIYKVIK